MAVSLTKSPSQLLDPTASYSAFLREDNDSGIAHQFAIVSGSTGQTMLSTSTTPHLLEFHRLT